jgi:transposase-like protein
MDELSSLRAIMNAPLDPLYRRHRFPAEVIGYAVWLYFRFPLSLRMVEEMLAALGIDVSHESVRHWAEKFGREYSNRIRRRARHSSWLFTRDLVRGRRRLLLGRQRLLLSQMLHDSCR